MTDTCVNCANSGELRNMIEKVAEKAARSAAENVKKDMQLDMLQLERRLEENIANKFELKLQEYFGMTSHEHAIEHDRVKKLYSMWSGISNDLWRKIIAGIIILALGISGAKLSASKALINQKPEPVSEKRIDV
jgi:hypothetical protein